MKETDNKNVDADYEYSRKTYYELIEKSKETLDLMADVEENQNTHVLLKYLVTW